MNELHNGYDDPFTHISFLYNTTIPHWHFSFGTTLSSQSGYLIELFVCVIYESPIQIWLWSGCITSFPQ